VQHFRPYLYGKKFLLITDHKPLTWLHKLKDPTSRLARWRIKLAEYDYEIVYKPGKINANADALSRNPTTNIYMIDCLYDEIKECPEDEEARQRNANPRPLPSSPRSGTMIEELEPEITGIQTRSIKKSEGESIPFTKRELQEPLFTEHVIHAEIHNNSETDQINKTGILILENNTNNNNIDNENNLNNQVNDKEPIILEDTYKSESNTNYKQNTYHNKKTVETLFGTGNNCNDVNSLNSQIIIPTNLLQILNNLSRESDNVKENQYKNQDIQGSKEGLEQMNEDNGSVKGDQDIDSNDSDNEEDDDEEEERNSENENEEDINIFNEINFDEINNQTEKQIITRSQKHSIINSRDKIFMRKENYLYFLTVDGKPCDEGAKELQKQNLIPKIKEARLGSLIEIKRGNKFHLIFICKNNINDEMTKENLQKLSSNLRKSLIRNSIKILNIAKTKEIDKQN